MDRGWTFQSQATTAGRKGDRHWVIRYHFVAGQAVPCGYLGDLSHDPLGRMVPLTLDEAKDRFARGHSYLGPHIISIGEASYWVDAEFCRRCSYTLGYNGFVWPGEVEQAELVAEALDRWEARLRELRRNGLLPDVGPREAKKERELASRSRQSSTWGDRFFVWEFAYELD